MKKDVTANRKRLLSLCAAMVIPLVIMLFSPTGYGAEITAQGTVNANISWVIIDGVLSVSGSGEIGDYAANTEVPWHTYRDSIKSIEVKGTITKIGALTFASLDNLTEVTICDSVTTIGDKVFAANMKLTTIKLPSSLAVLGNSVFMNNFKLTNITLAASNTRFNLSNGVLTDKAVTTIYWAGGISSSIYYIPNTVTEVKEYAFVGCNSTDVYVPDSVVTIGAYAFYNIENLYGVTGSAVASYAKENSITLANTFTGMCGDNAYWKIESKNSIITVTITGTGITSSVPWGSIMKSINILNVNGTITGFAANSFKGATALETINFNSTRLSGINVSCFQGCTSLRSVTFPSTVAGIGNYAFADCTSLSSVTLSANLNRIGEYAFRETAITTVTIPSNVKTIETGAFKYCNKLATINVHTSNTNFSSEKGVLYNKTKTEMLIYPGGKTTESFTVPGTVQKIGADCYGNKNLMYILIPETVTEISADAFMACPTEGDGGSTIIYGIDGSEAYQFAKSIHFTFIPIGGKAGLGTEWYYDMETKTLTFEGTGAISYDYTSWQTWRTETETAVFSEGITSIDSNFIFSSSYDQSNLKELTLPSTLESVANGAFYNVNQLTDIYYGGAADDWANIEMQPYDREKLNAAYIHYALVNTIKSVIAVNGGIYVTTEDMRDGKRVMVAAYAQNGAFISLHYVTITNNTGNIAVSTEGWSKVKAFMINLDTLVPASNAVEGTVVNS